ncbi:transmembrane protein 53-A [Apis dorsata]|uniref:transmembrane protein 53-A n=1 Tax=Apis dorsata TaxID=7462 RepID=UPI0003DF5383|nr:transmembrane protein 53-A [Apis dorsata]XP_006622886.1 transmembrane protein 53-A [Apis dorsata]
MVVERVILSTLTKIRLISCIKPQLLQQKQNLTNFLLVCKLSSYHVTKNIEHIMHDNQIRTDTIRQNFNNEKNRPLLILLSWLLPKHRHIMKFANLYVEQGFDIVILSITPWQLIWPIKGSRLVASDLLEFLIEHQNYQQIVLHGFSVGGYMWGEILDLIQSDYQKYNNVIERIVGQIWDSLADVTELSIGIPRAIFPKNKMLQNMFQKYLEYHMKAFYKQSTQYYIRSSQLFHTNLVHSPALFFVSKTDPVGSLTSNLRVKDQWDTVGVKTYIKIFEKSPHVGHYRKYPKEYVAELYTFLNKLPLIQHEKKMGAQF